MPLPGSGSMLCSAEFMDLNTVEQVVRPAERSAIPPFQAGDAFLAGGTWLYSEPQVGCRRLIDLTALGWPTLVCSEAGLHIAATCSLATLEQAAFPRAWLAASVVPQCCQALLGSFKIRRAATVGGNLCLALPAAPMAALAVALNGTCTIWTRDGRERILPASQLITDNQHTALMAGEILREVFLPASALRLRAAFRQMSLTALGRSAALLIGILDDRSVHLTITAAVKCPIRLTFAADLPVIEMAEAIDAAVPEWFDDVHGAPAWRRRITHVLAKEILHELRS
jgi:CO/xanthine dehydrogenase FAD-binding subunit